MRMKRITLYSWWRGNQEPVMKRKILSIALVLAALGVVVFLVRKISWVPAQAPLALAEHYDGPVGRIDGKVLGPNGKPQRDVVHVQQITRGGERGEVETDAAGCFKVEKAPLGRYRLSIRDEWAAELEITHTDR